jgi:hypothetical protein
MPRVARTPVTLDAHAEPDPDADPGVIPTRLGEQYVLEPAPRALVRSCTAAQPDHPDAKRAWAQLVAVLRREGGRHDR